MLDAQVVDGFVNSILAPGFDQRKPTPDFHRELWELCTSSHELIAVAAPRGHAKTTAVTHSYILAAVLFREHQFVVLVSDTETQAVDFLRDIKKELEGNDSLRDFFGVKRFAKDSESDVIVEMDDGYLFRIVAKGSEQKVRGIKWANKRPDLIVCDDLENDEIVMNKDRRDKFKRWFLGALMPCRSQRGKIRIVGTILHQGSLLNELMPKPWEKLTVTTPLKDWSKNTKTAWKAVKYRAHDSSFEHILWKEQFDKQKLMSIKRSYAEQGTPDLYSQEYLNEPIDEAVAFFKVKDFVGMTEAEKKAIKNKEIPLTYYAGADLAISLKERADWSVFHIVGVDSNNIMYHIDTIRERMDGREIVETIMNLQQKYNLNWFAIESEKIAKSLGPFLREEMLKRGIFINVVEIQPVADKLTRAKGIQARLRVGAMRFDKDADYYPKLEDEFRKFPRDVHDDQVDAYSIIGLALDKIIAANTVKERDEEEWEEFDRQYEFSGINSGRSVFTGY